LSSELFLSFYDFYFIETQQKMVSKYRAQLSKSREKDPLFLILSNLHLTMKGLSTACLLFSAVG